MPAPMSVLKRLNPRRAWFDRNGLSLVIWMAMAAGCLLLLLVSLTLFVDTLSIRGPEAAEFLHSGMESELIPVRIQSDAGLWVQAAHFGDRWLWSWLPGLCEAFPLLTTTQGTLSILVLLLLVLTVGLSFAHTRSRVAAARAARQTATWLRSAIHRQSLRLGPSDLTGQRYQTALGHFVNDTEAIRESLADWRWRKLRAAIFLPVLAVTILAIDWRLGLECLIPTIAGWWIYRYERQQGAAKRQVAEAHAETEIRFLADALKQSRLVRGYNIEEFEQTLFTRHLDRMTQDARTGRRLERAALSTARFVTWIVLTLILLLISMRVLSAENPLPLSSGVVMAVALACFAVELTSWERIASLRAQLEILGGQIYRYLDEIPEVGQAVGAKFIQPVAQAITLEAVSYQQRGHEILRGIDLKIEAHSEVALVSLDPLLPRTLAFLLPRFIEPTRGRILFDGEDIAWGTLESIRAETVFVGGDDPLLSGSVLENIICGDSHFSTNEAMEAAKLVHAHKFISRLPQGYETELGERGVQLSAGEAFRLGLARACLRNPAVLIIEEPQVLFDEDTKHLIDDAYQRLAVKRTVIYLPSRLSTVRRCDRVIMLHDGQIEATGAHSDLSKGSPLYRHWDYVTFNTFSRRSRRLQVTS